MSTPYPLGTLERAKNAEIARIGARIVVLESELAEGRRLDAIIVQGLSARIAELEAALARSADTFADLAKVSAMLGRTTIAEACCIAEGDARSTLAPKEP